MAWLAGWMFAIWLGYRIGEPKRRGSDGAILGALLGPLGWLIVAALSDLAEYCPECRSRLNERARRCHACGQTVETAAA